MTIVSASDSLSWRYCARRLWFDHNLPPEAEAVTPDPFDELMQGLGDEHERAVLAHLSADRTVEEATGVEHTRELMQAGVGLIYQGQLLDEAAGLFGKPDFLIRRDEGTYQAADAKLALSLKQETGIQVAAYRRLLGGHTPGLVYLGDGGTATVGPEFDAALNTFLTEARAVLEHDRPLVRYSDSKCTKCPYDSLCRPAFETAGELTLLYGLDSRAAPHLEAQGITTIAALAGSDPAAIDDVPYLKGPRKERAVLQAKAWQTGDMFRTGDIALSEGTYVHFDIEANPQTPDGHQQVYLWGFLVPPYGETDFDYVWSDGPADEYDGWRAFLDKVEGYRRTWPDVVLVHFSGYERIQIAAYARRYDMEVHDTVRWLLDRKGGPLFDIQKPVTGSLVLPLSSYGLKSICKHPRLVNFQWEDEGSGSQWSVVQYIRFLRSQDADERQALKQAILTYNRDDVTATRRLEEWLRAL